MLDFFPLKSNFVFFQKTRRRVFFDTRVQKFENGSFLFLLFKKQWKRKKTLERENNLSGRDRGLASRSH